MQVIQNRTCIHQSDHKIEDGMPKMQPLKSRIEAIQKVKPPKTVKECRSFCGMVNYSQCFYQVCKKVDSIYFITRKGIPFYWGEEQQKAFDEIKHDVTHAPVLLMQIQKTFCSGIRYL